MILIFSISTDSTTTEVVDWLKAFDPNISIVRINNDLQDVKFKQMIYTHNEKSLWVQTSQGELIDLFKAKVDVCFEIHLQMGMIQLFLLDMLNIIYIKKCQR